MACAAVAGCRLSNENGVPSCHRFVPMVPDNISVAALAALDGSAGHEIAGLPTSLLPARCNDALQRFICVSIVGGCAHRSKLPLCRSVCQEVRDGCSWLIRSMMPSEARQRLDCSLYPQGDWPSCANPRSAQQETCVSALAPSGHCHGAAPGKLREEPCGMCRQGAAGLPRFEALPRDACGLCNGDNSSCGGCDGANASLDACAACGGGEAVCKALDTDPKLLGYLASAGLALFLLLGLAALLLPCWRRRAAAKEAASSAACGTSWVKTQSRAFSWLGRKIAGRARSVIAVAVLLSLVAGSGLAGLRSQKDPLALWLPAGSSSEKASERWQAITGLPRPRHVQVLLAAPAAAPAPVREGLQQALALHGRLLQLRAGGHGLLGPNGSSSGGLAHARGGFVGPLSFWRYDERALAADPNPGRTLASALRSRSRPDGFVGAVASGQVTFAKEPAEGGGDGSLRALMLVYVLDGSQDRRAAAGAWERVLADFLQSEAAAGAWPLWRPHLFCEQLLSDELDGAISGDVTLIAFGYFLMCLYMSTFLGNRQDFVNARGMVAGFAVVSVGLATLAAFGICGAAGVLYNETVTIAFFVLMGVGVDDAFVIVRALEDVLERAGGGEAEAETFEDPDVEGRMGEALAECGPAILLSSATNALAFGMGAATPLPALRSFCIYASAGMITDFALQITFFVAILALDERRRLARRCMLLPCLPAASAEPVAKLPGVAAVSALQQRTLAWRRGAVKKLTSSTPVRCAVLLLFLTTSALSIWAAYTMPVGLKATDLVPAGSRSATFFDEAESLLPGRRQLVEIVVQHARLAGRPGDAVVDPHEPAVQQGLRSLRSSLQATSFLGGGGFVGPLWFEHFAEWLRLAGLPPAAALERERLSSQLAAFAVSQEGRLLEQEDALRTANGTVIATRIRVLAEGYDAPRMVALRATAAAADLGGAAFVHSMADIYNEQDAIMLEYTFQNLLWVMLAVLTSVLLVSASPSFVMVMAFCVLSCCSHMFGWMALTGAPLNALSLIPLLLAVGLCEDYCAHVAHAFQYQEGTPPERALAALRLRGAAVAHGGFSTALSMLLLAFSSSLVFIVFFKLMCGVVVVGLFHALVLLPACFSLLPGAGSVPHQQLPNGVKETASNGTWPEPAPANTIGRSCDGLHHSPEGSVLSASEMQS